MPKTEYLQGALDLLILRRDVRRKQTAQAQRFTLLCRECAAFVL